MKNFTLSACSAFPRSSITVLAFICSTEHLLRTSAIMDYHLDPWPFCYFVFIWNPLKDFNKDFFLFHTTAICKKVLFYLNEIASEKTVKSLSHVRLFATHELYPTRLLCPWDFPGENTGVGCHCLLQGIFPTQASHNAGRHFTVSGHLFSQECAPPLP